MSKQTKAIGASEALEQVRARLSRADFWGGEADTTLIGLAAEAIGANPRDAIDRKVQEMAFQRMVISPRPRKNPPTPHDEKIGKALLVREAAILAREHAERETWTAKDELAACEAATWMSDGHITHVGAQHKATPERLAALRERAEEARRTWQDARDAEGRARVEVTRLESLRDALWATMDRD